MSQMTNNAQSFFQKFVSLLQKIEDGILISLLLLMIVMAVLQIFLRNIFDSGILWGDSLVRVLVLWIGLMGAMVASRDYRHISIDVLSRYLPDSIKKMTTLIISIFTTVVCAIMAYYSFIFVIMEKEDGLIAFANVPAWVCESIIPISFTVISLRYLLYSFKNISSLFHGDR